MCMQWHKLLYGKGTAPRGLRDDIRCALLALGFVEAESDTCLYINKDRDIDIGVYVDDLEIVGSDESLEWVKRRLSERYEIKFLGNNDTTSGEKGKTFVGVRSEINRDTQVLTLDQEALITKGVEKFGFVNCRTRTTPADPTELDLLPVDAAVDVQYQKLYRSKVGFIMHVAMISRPDIAFCAIKAARVMARPPPNAMSFVDSILKYLSTTREQKLTYHCKHAPGSTTLASSDAAFADAIDCKSTVGWCLLVCGAAWSWGIETLQLVVLSSTEAEYCGASAVCKEIVFAKTLFADLRLDFPSPCTVMLDNMSAIALASGPAVHHQRTKHIANRYHYQRQLLLDNVVRYQHQSTEFIFTDVLTKELHKVAHTRHARVLSGIDPVQESGKELPQSQLQYVLRHNAQIASKLKTVDLQQKWEQRCAVERTRYALSPGCDEATEPGHVLPLKHVLNPG
jgi:hypothetical protein